MTDIREETVSLDKLALYDDIQMRVKLPGATITAYAKAMESGSSFDSIKCAELNGELIVYDGFLRKKAYAKSGATHVKVTVRIAESRDQIVLWAVQANSYQCLARSNEDKQRSVLRLLNTELGHTMTNRDIAKAAGVAEMTVGRYRKQQESKISTNNVSSESPSKVKTSRGERPRKYKTKEERERIKQVLEIPKVVWPTREETGAPPKELENEWHPDHPGMTYKGVHIKKYGITPLFSREKKDLQDNTIAMIEIVSSLRTINESCLKFETSKAKLTSLPDLLDLLGTKKGSVSLRDINQVRDNLNKVLPLIREFLDTTLTVVKSESETIPLRLVEK